MTKRRVLICGATGFIGRNLVERLAKRPDLAITATHHRRPPFDHPNVRWVQADLVNPADVERALEGVDAVIQAAASTSGSKDIVQRPYIHVTDNAVMNSLLFRACFEKKVEQVIFFSCVVMLQSSETPQDESAFDANLPIHPRYFGAGWTKVYIEKMCEFYSRIGPTRYTAIRHSNIYGPHDKFDLQRSHVFGATVTKVMTAQENEIVVWGSGEEKRDLLYVDDLSDFVERVLDRQREPFRLYNCGGGQAISVRTLVEKIIAHSGRPLSIRHDLSQPTIPTSLALDCRLAERELGWKPAFTLDEGIALTLQWWRDNAQRS